MAKGNNTKIENLETSWNGYTGERVEEFIKQEISNLQSTKVGYIFENSETEKVDFYSSENDYNEGKSPLGSIASKPLYTLYVKEDDSNKHTFLAGDENKNFTWYFKTVNNNEEKTLFAESVIVEYTFKNINNNTTKVVPLEIPSNNVTENEDFTTVTLDLNQYLSNGVTNITISVRGSVTKRTALLSRSITIILLEMTDVTNFSTPVVNSLVLGADVKCTLGTTYHMQYRFDNKEYVFNPAYDVIGTQTVDHPRYELPVGNLEDGKHVVEYRLFVTIDGQQQQYYTQTNRIEFIKGEGLVFDEPQILLYLTYYEGEDVITEDNNLIYNSVYQYIPFTIKYAVYNPFENTTILEFIDETENVENIAPVLSSIKNNEDKNVVFQFLDYGQKKMRIITKDSDNNTTNEGRVIYLNVKQSTLDIKICDKSLRIDFNSVSKTNDTNRDIWVSKVNSNGSEKIYNAYFNEEFNWSQGWTKNGLVISNNSEVSFDYCPFPKQEKGVSDEVAIEYIGGKIGYTLEIEFMTQNVTDENAIVCDMIDENKGKCGLLIKGTEIKFTTPNGNQVSSRFKDGEVNRAAIVVRPFYNANNEFKGLIELYMNGIICNVTTYNDSDAFEATELNDENRYVSKRLKFKGAKGADIIVKQIRAYNDALSSDEIVDNYILFKQDSSEMLTLYEDNKVLDGGNVSIQSVINKGDIPVLIFVGRTVGGELASGDGNDNGDEEYVAGDIASKSTYWYETLEKTSDKNETIDMDVIYYNPMDTRKNFKFVKAYIRPQGTSSMLYPKKNYRIYTQKNKDTRCFFPILDENGNMVTELDLNDMLKSNFGENEKDRIYEKWRGKNNYKKRKYSFKDGAQPVKCWCLKADFAETSSSHNTGVAKLWGDTLVNTSIKLGDEDSYVLRTNAQVAAKNIGYKYDVRTTIDGFPIVVFGAQSYSGPFTFLGKYNFNNDKSTESVFGFCDIDNENKITDDTFDYDTNTSGTTAHTLDWQLDKYMTCIETLDNGNALANFSTLENFDDNVDYDEKTGLDVKGWEKAFELRYPEKPEAPAPADYKNDKGEWIDKEQYEKDKEKYLTTDLRKWENEHIKPLRHFAKWLLSTRWCDVNGEPLYGELQSVAESGMEHDESGNVLTSVNEIIAYRQRKFSTEKWDHLDVWKMAAYYVYVMRFGAVDQVVKNTMLTSEGPFAFDDLGNKYGLLDMTDIESENYGRYFKWYYINYDNDTVMGVKNDGSLAFGPNISRSKKESDGNYSYAGWDSTLWNNFDTDDDFQKIVRMVDNGISNYLTYNRAKQMFDEEQVGAWCERIYNRDADYKYITPYTGGWQYDGKDESGKVPFSSKLFMLQGSRTAHRRWWLSKRFNLFDGKWNSGEFSNKFVEIKSNYAIIGSTFSAKAGANAYFGYQINKQTFNQGKKDGGTSFEYSAGETINWKLYKNIQIGDPIAIYGSADLMELNLQGISQNIQEMRFVFGNNEDNPNKLEILDISIPEDLLRGEYYYAAYSDYSRLQLDYSEELPININEDYWAELTFSENIEANESSVPFYRTIIYNEEIKENVTTFFAKKYGGIRNHSLTNDFTGFLNGLDKLQTFKMAGYAKVTSISLVANKFIETLDTRYSGVENIILPEGSRISDLRVSNSLNTLSFNRCNSIKLNNIIVDDKPLADNRGINIQVIESIDSEGLNHDNKFKDFILSWIKGGVGFKPTNSKTLRLNGIKWKGVSVKDIELLSSFVNEAYECYISGEISMGSTNISRNEKKIIDDFQNNPNIDVKIRYPYPSILINEANDIVAGEDITITSTIFADEFSEDENFNITYVFVKEVGASTNSNILHDLNTGKYYEQLSVNSIRNGSVSLKTDAYDKKKVILTTKEVICGEDTEILLASKFTYKNEIKFDVISFVIKDPTYANRGELIGPSSITSLTYEQGTYEYTLKLYTDKGDAPIGTIIKTWTLEGEGLNYIIDDGYVDENGLKLIITTNKSTPERADKLIIKVAIDNHNDAHRDFIIEKEVLILNENIIMTSQSNKVVMDICYRNGLSANSDAMSRDEAIAVTDIKNYFSNISSEFSFDELQFFTNVHTLKDNAFKNSNITSIILHNNITTIGDGIFEGCKKLRNVTLPDNIEVITEKMFLNCSSLETLYLPDTVKVIKPMAFGGTKIEKILFNEMKTKTLKVIYISQDASLESIENNAFETSNEWSTNTTNILNEVSIPNSLMITTGGFNFLLSKQINKINIGSNSDFYIENNVLYNDETKYTIIRALCNITADNIVDEIVLNNTYDIYEYAFFNSNVAKKITIGGIMAGNGMRKGVFHSSKFTEIDLSSADIKTLYAYTFFNMADVEKIILPQEGSLSKLETNMFSNSLKLEELTIPESVVYISSGQSSYFINKCGIKSFTVSDNIVNIPKNFITDCPYLEEFNYSPYCKIDGEEQIVVNCPSLKKIKLPLFSLTIGSNKHFVTKNGIIVAGPYYTENDAAIQLNFLTIREEYANIDKGNFEIVSYNTDDVVIINNNFYHNGKLNTFENCANIEIFELNENDNKKIMFISNNGVDGCTEHDTNLIEGKTVLRVDENGDKYLVKLANICDNYITPADVVGYDNGAFAYTHISEVTENMLANIRELPNGIFANTKQLETVILPKTVEIIGDYVFYASNVKGITLSENTTIIKQGVFSNCMYLETIKLPQSLRSIGGNNDGSVGSGVFENCTSLKQITIPNNVCEITRRLFFDCKNLETVEMLSNNIDVIERFAFCNCSKVRELKICSRNLPRIDVGNTQESNGVYKFHPFGYNSSTFMGNAITENKRLFVSYGTIEQYTNDYNWDMPLFEICKYTIEELPINEIITVTHTSLENYDIIYPVSQSGKFNISYGISKIDGAFEFVFNGDAYDGETIFIYSDSEHTNLICNFTLSYKKTVYNDADYVLGSTRKRILFGTSLFSNKQTETTPVNDEMVSITKAEYNLLMSKIDKLTRLINLKK